jgi:hypothetical protein
MRLRWQNKTAISGSTNQKETVRQEIVLPKVDGGQQGNNSSFGSRRRASHQIGSPNGFGQTHTFAFLGRDQTGSFSPSQQHEVSDQR